MSVQLIFFLKSVIITIIHITQKHIQQQNASFAQVQQDSVSSSIVHVRGNSLTQELVPFNQFWKPNSTKEYPDPGYDYCNL